ncbi:hypothetical protein MMC19_005301 [Ptychographa xylographoides]|nr:hypothetical protein [Ptychographa xylographoides]
MATAFPYTSLASSQIRLLHFARHDDDIRLEFIIAAMDRLPPYVALSYTWGNPTITRDIVIDNNHLQITDNLANALAVVCLRSVKDGIPYFWIDQICINQGDLAERSSQVVLMKSIYEKAHHVKAWLGSWPEEDNHILDAMRDFVYELKRRMDSRGGSMAAALDSISSRDADFIGVNGSKLRLWEGIVEVFRKQYWRRAWVMQEATSPAGIVVLCGGYPPFSWAFIQFIICLEARLSAMNLLPFVESTDFKYATLVDEVRILRGQHSTIYLLDALQQLRMCASTDPRDKVYAALGLVSGFEDGSIVADYTKSVQDVYIDVVLLLLSKQDGHQLDFLGHTINAAADSETIDAFDPAWPGWLPDWRNRIEITCFAKRLGSGELAAQKVYNASKDTIAIASIYKDRLLTVSGLSVGRISHVSTTCDWPNQQALSRSWLSADRQAGTYPTGETDQAAFLRTIVADVKVGGDPVIRGTAMNWSFFDSEESVSDDVLALSDDILCDKHLSRLRTLQSLGSATFGRRFFWTTEGYMGMGPAGAQVGDRVCLFFGGQVLYVVRDLEDQGWYRFVGECYVHGLMDGEAMEGRDVEEETEEFMLVL